jgi:hypothetical protein
MRESEGRVLLQAMGWPVTKSRGQIARGQRVEPVPLGPAEVSPPTRTTDDEHVTHDPLEFDEIGVWSELKLEIVEKYGSAYTNAFRTSTNLKKYYIDGFSGAGVHVSRRTGKQIEGSPTRALKVSPPFDSILLISTRGRPISSGQLVDTGPTSRSTQETATTF